MYFLPVTGLGEDDLGEGADIEALRFDEIYNNVDDVADMINPQHEAKSERFTYMYIYIYLI
jgi:hypothetical protein